MNSTQRVAHELLKRVPETRAQHLRGGFHESHPCGGCHFWSGYEAALRDVLSEQTPTNATLNHKRSWAQPPAKRYLTQEKEGPRCSAG